LINIQSYQIVLKTQNINILIINKSGGGDSHTNFYYFVFVGVFTNVNVLAPNLVFLRALKL